MKTRTEYTCPLELTHDITKGKWKPIILWQLGQGPHSLAGLKREIKGISQKMLIEQLRELCDYGMVSKTSYEGYPLKVEYALTSSGYHAGNRNRDDDGGRKRRIPAQKGIAGLRGYQTRLTPWLQKSV